MAVEKFAAFLDGTGTVLRVEKCDASGQPDGTPISSSDYHDEENELGKRVEGSLLSLTNRCCWKVVGGMWKCRPRYC